MADVVRQRPALRGAEVTVNILNIQIGSMLIEINPLHALIGNNMSLETNNNPLHALIAFIFFVLLGFLQIKFPDKSTAFKVHPKTIYVSIGSFVVYCLAFLGRLKFATIIQVHYFDTLMHLFGSLSLISMGLMLLPDTWGESLGFIMYILWFITPVLIVLIKTSANFVERWQQFRRRRGRPLLPTTSLD